MTKKIALGATLFAVLTLTACNTVNGAGRDLRLAGPVVSDASGQEKAEEKSQASPLQGERQS